MPRLAESILAKCLALCFKHSYRCGVVLPVGPEGPLTFLTGGFGSYLSERLRLKKDDVQVLVYSSIAGAFGGFFGSPVIGAVGAIEYMFIRELRSQSAFDSRPIGWLLLDMASTPQYCRSHF